MTIVRAARRPWAWRLAVWGSKRAFLRWLSSPAIGARLPALPKWLLGRFGVEPPIGPRTLDVPPIPAALRTTPGVVRDPEQEAAAFRHAPLPVWIRRYGVADDYQQRRNWMAVVLTNGLRRKAKRPSAGVKDFGAAGALTPAERTKRLKARAAVLGLSAIGIAKYNPLYTFGPYLEDRVGENVIVCLLEQNWAATQSIPSLRAEVAHFVTYARQEPLVRQLAAEIEGDGFRAVPGDASGRAIAIYYGVEAGLGQLGLNGQLLTPFAGSRCRLMLIQTDMPLEIDQPVDYGIPALCDSCQVCVRRCPSGAITTKRQWHRGVYKAKIRTERCFPMTSQLHGCAVCMKVCPVQRYGLPAVLEEFTNSGRILGKGTDELEGYVWPADGKRYGPSEKPREATGEQMLRPIDFHFDKPS